MTTHRTVYTTVPMISTFFLEFSTRSDSLPARGQPNTIPTPTMVRSSPASLLENPQQF